MRDPLDIIEQAESGGRNVPNYKYGPGFTASGHYQMINATWRRWAKAAGIDISQYPTAMSAPKGVQRAVAAQGFEMEGFRPWEATKHLVGQEANYSRAVPNAPKGATLAAGGGGGGVLSSASPIAAPGPNSPLPAGPTPEQLRTMSGILADTPDPFKQLAETRAAQEKEQQAQQLAQAMAASTKPEPQPQPTPAAPPEQPVNYAALLMPHLRRGLLGGGYGGLLA